MKFIDMFCGIGGFRLGLEKANQSCEEGQNGQGSPRLQPISNNIWYGRDKPKDRFGSFGQSAFCCIWANDNDRYVCQVYRKQFGTGELYEGDIRAVDPSAIPEHNLLCAGFPCQDFSIAGKQRGIEGTRGTLFFEICRVLRAKRPSYVFLENVRGLQSSDDGRAFGIILTSLDELGYDCQWQVLNSKDFGVPQNRERVFIVGHLRGKPRPKVFPIGEASSEDDTTELQYVGAIMSEQNERWLEDGKQLSRNFPQGQRIYSTDGIASSICGDAGGLGGKTGLYEIPLIAQALQTDGQLRSGVSWNTDKPQSSRNIRRLTPPECERLQGFPDGWTEGISDTQRYKCLGNAVTVNVIEAIGRQMVMDLRLNR